MKGFKSGLCAYGKPFQEKGYHVRFSDIKNSLKFVQKEKTLTFPGVNNLVLAVSGGFEPGQEIVLRPSAGGPEEEFLFNNDGTIASATHKDFLLGMKKVNGEEICVLVKADDIENRKVFELPQKLENAIQTEAISGSQDKDMGGEMVWEVRQVLCYGPKTA